VSYDVIVGSFVIVVVCFNDFEDRKETEELRFCNNKKLGRKNAGKEVMKKMSQRLKITCLFVGEGKVEEGRQRRKD